MVIEIVGDIMRCCKVLLSVSLLFSGLLAHAEDNRMYIKCSYIGLSATAAPKSYATPVVATSGTTAPTSKLLKNGWGGGIAVNMFVSDKFAFEGGVNLMRLHTKMANIAEFYTYYGMDDTIKRSNSYLVPIYVVGQWYPAPFGAIVPFFGVGGHFTYAKRKSRLYSMKNERGLVVQFGFNVVFRDDSMLTLEVKKFTFATNLTYNPKLVSDSNNTSDILTHRLSINPLALGIGYSMRF